MTDSTPTRRPFRLTPVWLVLGLLVVEGLLWLSERCRWFWFNERKGWTVLIALGSVGVVLALMLLWFVVSLLFHLRFQFGIRSLLVLVVAVAIPCSWLAGEMRKAKRQNVVVEEIKNLGGRVAYDWEGLDHNGVVPVHPQPPEPAWLRNLVGDDFFAEVETLWLDHTTVSDAGLESLKRLTALQRLYLQDTKITDTGLENLRGLTALRGLGLEGTKITDAGIENLRGLTALQYLLLMHTTVSDAGLENLSGLTALQDLRLEGTKITDAGLENLRGLTALQELVLNHTQITDTGLQNLRGLTALQSLGLEGTKITDSGLENLKRLTALQDLG